MDETKILVIDDEPQIGRLFSKILSEEGCKVLVSLNGKEGISTIKKEQPDLVFLDLKLPDIDGIEVLREIRRFDRELLVIVLTAYETVKSAVEAMKLGAYDYISKPVNIEKIKTIIENALRTRALTIATDLRQKTKEKIDFDRIIGNSPQMQKILDLVERAAPHDITVLLRGASGTGKELIARATHRKSKRAARPFIVIDCATLPDTLIESEIFGHEKGAFTGADRKKLGKFELAQGGTVFLDEIGNLTRQTQVKLLRALQQREIERLGGKTPIKVDFRLIAATNVDLEKAIKNEGLREDLYYRLNVFPIFLPSLRERDGDVELLAEYFLKRSNKLLGKRVKSLSTESLKFLSHYSWPGNVRELLNVIESAVILADDTILPQHLPQKVKDAGEEKQRFESSLKQVAKQAKMNAERELILRVLREENWNKSRASQILNVDYKTLFNKIKEYNIQRSI